MIRRKRPALVGLLLAALVMVPAVSSAPATAVVYASDWDPGYIISDEQFYDSGSMTEAQIQAFLDLKVPTCETWKTLGPHDPIVCLKDYRMTTLSFAADAFCPGGYVGATNERASSIIYKVARSCGINPKVLLVTLEKETSLVTHKYPSTWRYDRAMGYGCSDTAPCIETYGGLQKQLFLAAKQFQRYKATPANYNYRAGQDNNIYFYPPNSKPYCGYSKVFIRNVATASLYNYTPYQPNSAALSNMYGTGDDCSSYGNRNFFRLFTDWFGSTYASNPMMSTDETEYLAGIDPLGRMWAYPVAAGGYWGTRTSLGPGWTGIEQLVGIGDFDGNGHRDLIGIDAARKVWLYMGDGRLEYPVRKAVNVDWSSMRHIAYGGDSNGDGIPDTYTIDPSGKLQLWHGDGEGGFAPPVDLPGDFSTITLLAGVGDVNGDDRGDLLMRRPDGALLLYGGDGSNGLLPPVLVSTGWNTVIDIYALDLDRDEDTDLIVRTSVGQLILWAGDGSGSFSYVGIVDSGWSTMGPVTGAGPLQLDADSPPAPPTPAVPVAPGATGVGDFDGDGHNDIIGVSKSGALQLYRGTGQGGVHSAVTILNASWGTNVMTVPAGDFNSDGFQDIARLTTAGDFEVAYGGMNSVLSAPVKVATGWSSYNLLISGLDWDGDGAVDVIARDGAGDLWLHRSNGVGGWAPNQPTLIGRGWGSMTAIFPAGDFDGKGGVDILARASDGSLILYPGDGEGRFKGSRKIDAGWSSFVSLYSPGQFDTLSGPDILARTPDGRLFLYSGTGSGLVRQQYRLIDSGWNTMHSIG
jgi:hypothetical protein